MEIIGLKKFFKKKSHRYKNKILLKIMYHIYSEIKFVIQKKEEDK